MPPTQAESVTRKIGQECAVHGEIVSETLIAFMVKAVILDPSNGFTMDITLMKSDVQNLVKLCMAQLLYTKNPSLDTIKILGSVTREITDNRACAKEELESLYRKIISYVLLRSGLGSPTGIKTVREVTAALQSVFPQAELGTFLTLSKKDKECQLKELTMIVTGIRLFNRDCGKGGEGIDNLPGVLHEAIPATPQHVDDQLEKTQHQAYCYTAVLEKAADNPFMKAELQPYMLKQALYNMRQCEVFLQIILSDIITGAQEVEMMTKQLGALLEQLKVTVKSKTAVPTSQPFLGTHELFLPERIMQHHLNGVTVKTDMCRTKEHMEDRVNVVFLETTANFDELLIQYRGFCAYTFAATDGFLLPGISLEIRLGNFLSSRRTTALSK
uniref:Cilia- and flagella-associated protein 206 n=1 Tax=Saimiri boliviensis boliviensis TaxID=39432 RepID=A0A2K6S8H6_SAIBB